ncbi:MAG TPA: hypothetical protein VFF79_00345 [Conexibacter sp.]|jgi:hypothetical protein|nr:hypothetical protein [Conexibacter sp.]
MRTSLKLCLAGLAAALLLASSVTTASANHLSISNQGIRAVWRELTFNAKPTQLIQPGAIRCPATLEGTFHSRTIAKVAGQLIGFITRAIVGHPCVGMEGKEFFFHNGTEAVLGEPPTSLPWHMTYSGFTGTLPVLTGLIVNIVGIRMTVLYGLGNCLEIYGSATESRPWVFNIEAAGAVTSLQPGSGHLIQQQGTSALCPELGRLSEPSGPVTVLGGTTHITISLI